MRVLLTGASSGIGAEVARLLARRGDDVVLVARGTQGLRKTAAAVEELGATAVIAEADVTDRVALQAAVDRGAASLGGLDAVIANAGAAAYGVFMHSDPDDVALIPRPVRDRGFVQIVRLALRKPGDDEPGRGIWRPSGTGDTDMLAKR